MNICTQLRTLAMALMVALALMSLPAAQAYAAPNRDPRAAACAARGFIWADGLGCADKSCYLGQPGDTELIGGRIYMCDGFSGLWIPLSSDSIAPGSSVPPPTRRP
jgi:hypothetical protein